MRAESVLAPEWMLALIGAALLGAAIALAIAYLVSYRRGGTGPRGQLDEAIDGVTRRAVAAASGTSASSTEPELAEAALPPLTLADSGGPALPDPHWGSQTLEVADPTVHTAPWSDALLGGRIPDVADRSVPAVAPWGETPAVADPSVPAAWPDAPWGDQRLRVADQSAPAAWPDAPRDARTPDVVASPMPAVALPDHPWGNEAPGVAAAPVRAADLPDDPWGGETPHLATAPEPAAILPDDAWGGEAPHMATAPEPAVTLPDHPFGSEPPDIVALPMPGAALPDAPWSGETPDMAAAPMPDLTLPNDPWGGETPDMATPPVPDGQGEIRGSAPSSRRGTSRRHRQRSRRS